MRDEDKSKEQLLQELKDLRRGVKKKLSRDYPLFASIMETGPAAADELEQSISLLQATLESTADGLLVIDKAGKIVAYNQKFAQMWRIPESVLNAREDDRALAFVLEQLKDPEGFLNKVNELYGQPEAESYDLLEFKDGRFFERFSQPQHIGQNIVGRVWSFRDVTARKQAEEALKESEEHYRSLFDNMLNGLAYCQMIFEHNQPIDFIYLSVNNAFEGLTGLTEVTGKKVSEVIPGIRESDPEMFKIYGRVALTGKPERFETYVKALGMWFSIAVYSPRKEFFVAVFDVITARKQVEEALKESEEKYRKLMETANDAILIADVETGLILDANRKAQELCGLPAERIIGQHQSQIHPPEEAERYQDIFRTHCKLGGIIDEDMYVVNSEGRRTPVEISASTIEVKGKKLIYGVFRDLTVRRQAEEALRRSEKKYRLLVNQLPAVVFKGYRDWTVDFFDSKIELLTGYSKDDFDSRRIKWSDLILPEDLEYARKIFIDALKTDGSFVREHRIRKKDGEIRWIQCRGQIIFDAEGKIDHVSGVTFDITPHKQADEALRRSEEKYRLLVNQIPAMVFKGYADWSVDFFDNKIEALTGYPKEDFDSRRIKWSDVVLPEDLDNATKVFVNGLKGGGSYMREHRVRRKDGEIRWVQCWGQIFLDAAGKIDYISGVTFDITERKRAEDKLAKFNECLLNLGTNAGENVNRLVALAGELLGAACALYNRLDQEGMLCSFGQWQTPPDYNPLDQPEGHICYDVIRAGQDEPLVITNLPETPYAQTDPNVTAYNLKTYIGHPVRFGEDWVGSLCVVYQEDFVPSAADLKILGAVASAIGIEESRRLSLDALQESERKYRQLVDQIPAVVYRGYLDWSLDCFDRKIEDITGYSPEEFNSRRKTWLDLIFPEDVEEAKNDLLAARKGDGSYVTEHRIHQKSGEVRWIQARNKLIYNAAGKVDHLSGVFFDITERKELEGQLNKAQRMEAIGILAGGLAHDFNNLLTAIMGYGEMMLLGLRKEDPFFSYVEEITKAANRGASLTNQLLTFSRKQIMQPRVINLNEVVLDMDMMLRRLIGEDIELITSIDRELGLVKVDPGQIEQIIMNLAVNARDAMPDGGKLTVETANAELDEAYARSHVGVTPGSHVMLAVSDNGLGMEAETMARIFEPFFTTKESGKGTGLGLATVYGIVKQSGGHIWVYSEPGQGTTFKIYLPRVEEKAEELKAKITPPTTLEGEETILVVEDDTALRELISTALRRYGFKVLEAGHGGEALLICESYDLPIHLMLTDVVMPQISGTALAERLKQLHPEMKVLYMSGYTEDAIIHHGVLDSRVNFIPKPFRMLALVQKVREVLDFLEEKKPLP